jgi:hypothetical protein
MSWCASTRAAEGELPVLSRISYIVDVGVPPEVPPVFRKAQRGTVPRRAPLSGLVEQAARRRRGATWAKCARMARQRREGQGRQARPPLTSRRTFIGEFSPCSCRRLKDHGHPRFIVPRFSKLRIELDLRRDTTDFAACHSTLRSDFPRQSGRPKVGGNSRKRVC